MCYGGGGVGGGGGDGGGDGGCGGDGDGVSGLLTYRHETYTGVCRLYVHFVQKKQTYNLQTPVILVLNSVGVMSICKVLSRLKSLKDLPSPNLDKLYNFFQTPNWAPYDLLDVRFPFQYSAYLNPFICP